MLFLSVKHILVMFHCSVNDYNRVLHGWHFAIKH